MGYTLIGIPHFRYSASILVSTILAMVSAVAFDVILVDVIVATILAGNTNEVSEAIVIIMSITCGPVCGYPTVTLVVIPNAEIVCAKNPRLVIDDPNRSLLLMLPAVTVTDPAVIDGLPKRSVVEIPAAIKLVTVPADI